MTRIAFFSLLTVSILAACGGPAVPSLTPGQSPSPGSSPGASPTPSAPPSVPAGGIAHPTDPGTVILQYEVGGGFVPMEFFITQAPQFSLYGDGTVVWRPAEDMGRRIAVPGGLPRFVQGKMNEDAVQALLGFALGQGRLAGAREVYNQDGCADCPTTFFRISADGMTKEVTIHALSDLAEGPEAIDRAGFWMLADTLTNFDEQARNGIAGDVALYDPSHYRVVLSQAQPEMGEFGEWPWADLTIEDFASADADWQRRAVLFRDQVALLTEVPSGGIASIMVEDPDGGLWTVGVRPLLPDEIMAEVK
jgi:hypothetical protein